MTTQIPLEQIILEDLIKNIELSASMELFGKKRVKVEIDIDALIESIGREMLRFGAIHQNHTGGTFMERTNINDYWIDYTMDIHFDTHVVSAKPKWENVTRRVRSGYERITNDTDNQKEI